MARGFAVCSTSALSVTQFEMKFYVYFSQLRNRLTYPILSRMRHMTTSLPLLIGSRAVDMVSQASNQAR